MSWKQEAKEIKRRKYGFYCNMCKDMNIKPESYHIFDIDLYNKVKKDYEVFRNK